MSKPKIINAKVQAGTWHAEIAGSATEEPRIIVTASEGKLDGVELSFDDTRQLWAISVPIPTTLVNEGVQTILASTEEGEVLSHFSILVGTSAAEDLRAEVDLLRDELDILKAAFRRHCSGG